MSEAVQSKSLAEALARIYAAGGAYVQKTGKMEAGPARYRYAKEGDFIAAIRPLMEAHGVTIRPVGMQVVTNESFERKSGSAAYRVVILATFELLHTSGDSKQVQAFGEGQDSGDKAFNKAMTGAMKYALRQTFCVETGDDPDDTPSHEQERKPAPHRQPEPAPAKSQSAPDPNARWDCKVGDDVLRNLTTEQVRAAIAESGKAPGDVFLKPSGGAQGTGKPADQWGFRPTA